MIQYDENTFYLIGGWQDDKISANTHVLERVSQDKWDVYPWGPLKHARMGHSCAKMDRDGHTILVVAGGRNQDYFYDYVEMLDVSSSQSFIWVPGKMFCFLFQNWFDGLI